jgi:hypothetical protein
MTYRLHETVVQPIVEARRKGRGSKFRFEAIGAYGVA